MDPPDAIGLGEPVRWILAFSRETSVPWLKRLPLTYRHVAAFGYVGSGVDAWLFYSWRTDRLQIAAARGDTAVRTLMHAFAKDADLLGIDARREPTLGLRLGAWCVPAVKHLIGLRSRAVTPAGLYRDCLAAGAEVIR